MNIVKLYWRIRSSVLRCKYGQKFAPGDIIRTLTGERAVVVFPPKTAEPRDLPWVVYAIEEGDHDVWGLVPEMQRKIKVSDAPPVYTPPPAKLEYDDILREGWGRHPG